jgi:hypothetical protein
LTDEVHLKKNEKKSLQKKNRKTQTLSFFLVHEGNKRLKETDFVCSDVDKAWRNDVGEGKTGKRPRRPRMQVGNL